MTQPIPPTLIPVPTLPSLNAKYDALATVMVVIEQNNTATNHYMAQCLQFFGEQLSRMVSAMNQFGEQDAKLASRQSTVSMPKSPWEAV